MHKTIYMLVIFFSCNKCKITHQILVTIYGAISSGKKVLRYWYQDASIRRSERVKREKPDYYDALEFDNKRKMPTASNRCER